MTGKVDRHVAERRGAAANQWRELIGATRSETGARTDSPAWWAAIFGLALGLELARRVLDPKR